MRKKKEEKLKELMSSAIRLELVNQASNVAAEILLDIVDARQYHYVVETESDETGFKLYISKSANDDEHILVMEYDYSEAMWVMTNQNAVRDILEDNLLEARHIIISSTNSIYNSDKCIF